MREQKKKKFLTDTLLVLMLVVQIHQADQQKTVGLKVTFVCSVSDIDTILKIDNRTSFLAIFRNIM